MSAAPPPLPPSGTRRLLSQYCMVLLVFCPLVTGAVALAVSPPGEFWSSFHVAITIAVVTASVSFAVIAAVMLVDRRRARASELSRGRLWYLGWSLASMPLGLLASAEVTLLFFGFRAPASLADYRFGVLVGTAITGGFFLWYARRDAEHAARLLQLRLEQAQATTLQAQLAALTSQLNPHLLFNALNTIAALIPSDPERAEQTVVHLAELYRGVLRATQRDEHELGAELAICKAYLDVEQARFGERLRACFEIEAGLDLASLCVPVLILQPLVENAVKHGLCSKSQGGSITVRAEGSALGELRLLVVDDGVGFGNSSQRGAGVGVEVTRRRLQHLYGAGAELRFEVPTAGGTRAVLRLPQRPLSSTLDDAGASHTGAPHAALFHCR